jgi:hypothetical protein
MRRALLLLSVLAAASAAASARAAAKPPIVFPVLGAVAYRDDFGDARSDGPPHPGNDLLAPRKALALAAESGTVEFWTTSATAGCMLYLHGDSGTTYVYIHLNNDLGTGNDNKGSCVPGVAYAPGLVDGARVAAGEPVGFVGDSGDANGLHPHLHFEVHPRDGKAVDPFPYLKRARHLLFWEPDERVFTLVLDGTVTAADAGTVTLSVARLREWPSHERTLKLAAPLTLTAGDQAPAVGDRVRVWTAPAPADTAARSGAAGAIAVSKLLVR